MTLASHLDCRAADERAWWARNGFIEPLKFADALETYDVDASIHGGGVSGQAGALRMAIARSLVELDPELRDSLKKAGLRDGDIVHIGAFSFEYEEEM